MPIPPNLTPATAVDLSSILTSQINAVDIALAPTQSTNYASTAVGGNPALNRREVWYKYTTGAAERQFSIDADQIDRLGQYDPVLSIWTGPDVDNLTQYKIIGPTETQNFADNTGGGFGFFVPVQINTTYYFQVIDDDAAVPTTGLLFTVFRAPNENIPVGSLLISDDIDYFPASVLSPTDAEPLRYIADYPAGESADTQPDGTMCMQDDEEGEGIKILNSSFGVIAAISYAPRGVVGIRSDKNGNFYIQTTDGITVILYKITSTGVAVTNWTLPSNALGAVVCGVSRDGETYYYAKRTNGDPIRAFSLVTGLALPDFHAAIGVERPFGFSCIVVDSNDNVYIQYASDGVGATPKLRKFDSTGTLLITQALTTVAFTRNNRMDIDDVSDTIWLWGTSGGISPTVLQQRLLSDLSLQLEIDNIPTYGTSGNWGEQDEPFGVSNSCPLVVLPVAIAPPTPTIFSGIYELVPDKRNDTLYLTFDPETGEDVAIPRPSLITGFLSDN